MTISPKMQDAINEQIHFEFDSAYLYLAMSFQCEERSFPGCASWLRLQWKEEIGHGMRLAGYLHSRGGQVALEALERPAARFDSLLGLFERVLEHEREVTARIHRLYELAVAEKDHASAAELQWFIREQVEEEESAMAVVEQLKMVGEHRPALLMLDRRLGERQGA